MRLFRKMLNNRWMVSCLLIGFILAAAMVSSIPVYTHGTLQRMLLRDLENFQVSSGYFPGGYDAKSTLYGYEKGDIINTYKSLNDKISNEMSKEIGLPALSSSCILTNDFLRLGSEKDGTNNPKAVKIETMSGFQNHVTVSQGTMFNAQKSDGAYEVMVSEMAAKELNIIPGKIYTLYNIIHEDTEPIKVKVTGIFTIKDKRDPYWPDSDVGFADSLFIDFDEFNNDYIKNDTASISYAEWYYAFDYQKLSVDNLKKLVSTIESQAKWFKTSGGVEYKMYAFPILEKYSGRESSLKLTLSVIHIPVILMLAFYLFMVSRLIIDQERNEIAVFKSRGAGRLEIIKTYLLEAVTLGIVAFIIGPLFGLALCKILGTSNGFLEFVQRTALPVRLDLNAYIYSFCTVAAIVITMVSPAVPASKTTIVEYKQNQARVRQKPVWEKYFLDILLLGISCYGLFSYRSRQKILMVTGAKSADIPVDPLLFIISTFFILSAGMVFLRLYPYLIKLVFRIGRKRWKPAVYSSLINVSRSRGMEQFIMLFLILTVSIGVFDANAARTINTNVEEKEKYNVGADIVIKAKWASNKDSVVTSTMGPDASNSSQGTQPTIYTEPPFSDYQNLSGVLTATKVFKRDDAVCSTDEKGAGSVTLMGITPSEFGKIAWFRNDLLPYHWYNYLNLLTKAPRGMLLSRSLEKKLNVKVGDSIQLKWDEDNYLDGYVFAFVDYWPSFNPYGTVESNNSKDLVVANLSYIQAKTPLEPYEVWVKKKPGATSEQIYNDITRKKLNIISLEDADQQIITKKNDPMLQGTNGALTLGFIVTVIISTIGFLIYWILSIKSRNMQFGIFRAMGVSKKEILGMLSCEQFLVSGTSMLAGVVLGGIASDLFVPLLQIAYSSGEQVPPFRVTASGSDYIKLYIIIGIMIALGLFILGTMISKIKVDQAIKLGDD